MTVSRDDGIEGEILVEVIRLLAAALIHSAIEQNFGAFNFQNVHRAGSGLGAAIKRYLHFRLPQHWSRMNCAKSDSSCQISVTQIRCASKNLIDVLMPSLFYTQVNCIFCRIISGEAPAKIFYETDDVIVFHDRAQAMPIHLLICPKTHYRDFMDAPPEVHRMLAETVKHVVEELGDKAKDFRVMINNGPRSGQTVFHLHYHLLSGR